MEQTTKKLGLWIKFKTRLIVWSILFSNFVNEIALISISTLSAFAIGMLTRDSLGILWVEYALYGIGAFVFVFTLIKNRFMFSYTRKAVIEVLKHKKTRKIIKNDLKNLKAKQSIDAYKEL